MSSNEGSLGVERDVLGGPGYIRLGCDSTCRPSIAWLHLLRRLESVMEPAISTPDLQVRQDIRDPSREVVGSARSEGAAEEAKAGQQNTADPEQAAKNATSPT